MRVVLDPNVLLSAIIAPGGTSDRAVRAVTANAHLVLSRRVVERFLSRAGEEKFRRWFTMSDARALAERLLDAGEVVDEPSDVPQIVERDPSDDYLVALARAQHAVLVTGDRGIHRSMTKAHDLVVLDPAGLLGAMEGEAGNGPPDSGV